MKRHLYHGSDHIIEKPEYAYCNKYNDYGLGFYCTTDIKLAREWATRRNNSGFVNKYSIRDDNFKIVDLTDSNHDVLNWIALLMNNRTIANDLKEMYPRELEYLFKHYLIDVKEYDVVIGYRADDAYFRFPEAFIRGDISLETIKEVYLLKDLGKQYVLISQRAFKNIHFIDYIETNENDRNDYYHRKDNADKRFIELLEKDRYSSDTRLRDLVIKND